MDNQIQELMKMISFYLGVTAQLIFLLPEKALKTIIASISVFAYLVLITSGDIHYILKEQDSNWLILVILFLVLNKKNVLKKINLTTISVFSAIYFYLLLTQPNMVFYFPSIIGLLFLLMIAVYAKANLGRLFLLVFYIYSFTNILIFINYEVLRNNAASSTYLDSFTLGMFQGLYSVQVLLIGFIVPYILFTLEPRTVKNDTLKNNAKLLISHFMEHVIDLSKRVESSRSRILQVSQTVILSLFLLIINDVLRIISTESFVAILLSGITIFSNKLESSL